MFKRRTVFVVGAGCSTELGLPAGPQLLDEMYATLSDRGSARFEQVYQAFIRSGAPEANTNLDRRIDQFRIGLATAPSIDQYLDFHRADPAFVMLGKCTLAAQILHAESASLLNEERATEPLPDVWLRRLFYHLMDSTTRENARDILHNVSFICFNYDRIIEVFFRRALEALVQCSSTETDQLLENLRVWHPYGTVGGSEPNAPGMATPKRAFTDRRVGWDDVLAAARSLRTFTEGARDQEERDQIRGALFDAEQIVFLGFSYLPANMSLLSDAPMGVDAYPIYGTTYKMAEPHVELAKQRILATLGPDKDPNRIEHRVKFYDQTASQFVLEFGPALRA